MAKSNYCIALWVVVCIDFRSSVGKAINYRNENSKVNCSKNVPGRARNFMT